MKRLELGRAAGGDDLPCPASVHTLAVDTQVSRGRRDVGDFSPVFSSGIRNERRLNREPGDLPPQHSQGSEAIHGGVIGPPHGELKFLAELIQRAAVDGTNSVFEVVVLVQFLVDQRDPPVTVGVGQPTVNPASDRIDDTPVK